MWKYIGLYFRNVLTYDMVFAGSSPLHYVCFNDHSNQERRPDAAAFLIAYGADFNIKNKAGDNLLQQELRNQKAERAILESIVNCSLKLPSLELLCPTMCASNPSQQGYNRNENASPSGISKYEWYRSFCRDPRTLQHCCRYVIRQTLGGQRLRKVPTLPLPTTLKEYLLLDVETFSWRCVNRRKVNGETVWWTVNSRMISNLVTEKQFCLALARSNINLEQLWLWVDLWPWCRLPALVWWLYLRL